MVSREHRFQGPRSLKFVYQKGVTARGPFFAVKAARNPRRQTYRVAVVVSRKVHKSAVVRNRIRRRLYEIVRGIEGNISEPYDIVFNVFNDSIAKESPKILAAQVKKQLSAADVLKKPPSK